MHDKLTGYTFTQKFSDMPDTWESMELVQMKPWSPLRRWLYHAWRWTRIPITLIGFVAACVALSLVMPEPWKVICPPICTFAGLFVGAAMVRAGWLFGEDLDGVDLQ